MSRTAILTDRASRLIPLSSVLLIADQKESLTCISLLPDFALLSNTIISALFLLLLLLSIFLRHTNRRKKKCYATKDVEQLSKHVKNVIKQGAGWLAYNLCILFSIICIQIDSTPVICFTRFSTHSFQHTRSYLTMTLQLDCWSVIDRRHSTTNSVHVHC